MSSSSCSRLLGVNLRLWLLRYSHSLLKAMTCACAHSTTLGLCMQPHAVSIALQIRMPYCNVHSLDPPVLGHSVWKVLTPSLTEAQAKRAQVWERSEQMVCSHRVYHFGTSYCTLSAACAMSRRGRVGAGQLPSCSSCFNRLLLP